jgi:hypothetical protein
VPSCRNLLSRGASKCARACPRHLEESLTWLVLDLEEPMRDAANYVEALSLIGRGLIATRDNGGEAIIAVASAASDSLDALKEKWEKARAANRRRLRKTRRRRRT